MKYPKVIEGKNPERVHKCYLDSPTDWLAQYNMLLPDGVTCKDCTHCEKCCLIFGQKDTATSCQFYPSRYFESSLAIPKQ